MLGTPALINMTLEIDVPIRFHSSGLEYSTSEPNARDYSSGYQGRICYGICLSINSLLSFQEDETFSGGLRCRCRRCHLIGGGWAPLRMNQG